MDSNELYDVMWSFARHEVITLAAKIGLFRTLADRGDSWTSAYDIATTLDLDTAATCKMLRALCALGMIEVDNPSDGTTNDAPNATLFRLTDTTTSLFTGTDTDVTPFIAHSRELSRRWAGNLEDWLKTGKVPRGPRSAERMREFSDGMRGGAAMTIPYALEAIAPGNASSMLDLGGGTGAYATAMCRANKNLRAVVLEQEMVAQMGRDDLEGKDVADRVEFLGGNYLTTDLDRQFDIVLLANVLHQERPEGAAALVRRAAELTAPGGRTIVVDFAIDEARNKHPIGTLFAINMRDFGDTYPFSRIKSWMDAAGLENIEQHDVTSSHWVIAGHKA